MGTTKMRIPGTRQSNSARRHQTRTAGGWRSLAALATTFAIAVAADAAMAQDEEAVCGSVTCLADELMDLIPEGEKIALVPLWAPVTNLPEEESKSLYDDLYRAMSNASGRRHDVVKRNREYDELWEELQWELTETKYQKYVDELRANVVVRCQDLGLNGRKIVLTCTATGVGEGSKLSGKMEASKAVIPINRDLFPYEYVLSRLGNKLAKDTKEPKTILKTFITEGGTEQRSRLTKHIGGKLYDVIWTWFEGIRKEREQDREFNEITGNEGNEPAGASGGYKLLGSIKWLDERTLELQTELQDGGKRIAHASEQFDKNWIPRTLIGLAPLRYYKEAHAIPSRSLSKEIALVAAGNLARARIVAEALDIEAPDVADITSEAEGMAALRLFERGIPVDEELDSWSGAEGDKFVTLEARVVPIGSALRPKVDAALEQDDLRTEDEIRITMSAEEPVHAAVFAWGADNSVFRLYPNKNRPELTLPQGRRISLPSASDRIIIRSKPLPGHMENYEAIIVIASSKPLDFGGAERQAFREVSAFLEALATLDLSYANFVILPYRIRQ